MDDLSNTTCRLCGSAVNHAYKAELLNYMVNYFQCVECNYFQTETPYWLDEAYSDAINDSDTGILVRNLDNARRVIMTLFSLNDLNGRVLDYAGGYGVLVRLLRDLGIDAFWSDKHCTNLLAKGFEHTAGKYSLVTAFEVFEHFENPVEELNNLLEYTDNVLVSTELFTLSQGPEKDWWYRAPEHGQHIGFFDVHSLAALAAKCNCYVSTLGTSVHLFSRKPVPATWKIATRLSRFAPLIARLKLRSKTLQDFEMVRRENRL